MFWSPQKYRILRTPMKPRHTPIAMPRYDVDVIDGNARCSEFNMYSPVGPKQPAGVRPGHQKPMGQPGTPSSHGSVPGQSGFASMNTAYTISGKTHLVGRTHAKI